MPVRFRPRALPHTSHKVTMSNLVRAYLVMSMDDVASVSLGTDRPSTHLWRSEKSSIPPKRLIWVDDRLSADQAYRYAKQGVGMVWCGDFHQAKQCLSGLSRRVDQHLRGRSAVETPKINTDSTQVLTLFEQHRQRQARRAKILDHVLVPLEANYKIRLRRAPDMTAILLHIYGETHEPSIIPLKTLLGIMGAEQWQQRGIELHVLQSLTASSAIPKIYPHYGVFSPVRGEYLELVAKAPMSHVKIAFDIGTGTGVLAAILAHRGVEKVIATDNHPRALRCAEQNIVQLGYAHRVDICHCDLFPEGQADLVVCNPPWLPAQPHTAIEHAIYDPNSQMLRGFLAGLAAHLTQQGEGWLIMSNLAELLGLRRSDELAQWIASAGLEVIARMDCKPTHSKVNDVTDPLHVARAAEITSLWRLRVAGVIVSTKNKCH
jgi:tRNA1(Val) A37 N6-methylase TrmN6